MTFVPLPKHQSDADKRLAVLFSVFAYSLHYFVKKIDKTFCYACFSVRGNVNNAIFVVFYGEVLF